MIIPNLPFGYKTRDWWAKAIKQIAENAAQVLPGHTSEDAGKVLKVGGTGNLEWGTDEGVPEGGQIGDVLTKGESGPNWAPPAEDLPVIHADDVGKVLGIVENDGEQIPMWTSQVKGTEDSGRVTLEQTTDAANGQGATLELYHDEQSGYTDRPTAFLGITASNGRANIEMSSKNRPEVLFDISDGSQYYSPMLNGFPTRWWNNSLITKRYVDTEVLPLFPKVIPFSGQASSSADGLPIPTSLTADKLAKYKLLVLNITPLDFSSGNLVIGLPFLAFFVRNQEAGQNTVWYHCGDTMPDDFIDGGFRHDVKLTYLHDYHAMNKRIAYNATLGKWMAEGYASATRCRYGELNLANLSNGATAAITCRVIDSGPSSYQGICTSFELSRVFGFYFND